jgi:AraC-like DNA-binding protein
MLLSQMRRLFIYKEPMKSTFSTSEVFQPQTLDYWRNLLTLWLLPVEIEAPEHKAVNLNANLQLHATGVFTLVQIEATPHWVLRTESCLAMDTQKDSWIVLFQKKGTAQVEQGKNRSTLKPGELAILDAQQTFSIHYTESFSQVVLLLPRVASVKATKFSNRVVALAKASEIKFAKLFTNLVMSITQCQVKTYLNRETMAIKEALFNLFDGLVGDFLDETTTAATNSKAYLMDRLLKFIVEHLTDEELSVAMVASHMGFSARHVQTLFKETQAEQITLMAWVWEQRLKMAYRLLSQKECVHRSLVDLAVSLGFKKQSHFSRVFKERYGLTPSTFIKQQYLNHSVLKGNG